MHSCSDWIRSIPGARLIALSEHVTYWDHTGWKDPYSSDQLTDRQAVYVSKFGLPSAYTPQFVIDGFDELKLTEREGMSAVFEKALRNPKIPVTIASAHIDTAAPGLLRGHIDIDGTTNNLPADIYVAVTLNQVTSAIPSGENQGRTLTEIAVVVDLEKIAKLARGENLSRDFAVKLKPSLNKANLGVAVFAQASASRKVVGAASVEHVN
jgi:hypothetical protein